MDKTLALMIGAMVLILTAAVSLMFFADSTQDFDENSEQVENTGCEYQKSQYINRRAEEEDLSSRCPVEKEDKLLRGVVDACPSC